MVVVLAMVVVVVVVVAVVVVVVVVVVVDVCVGSGLVTFEQAFCTCTITKVISLLVNKICKLPLINVLTSLTGKSQV